MTKFDTTGSVSNVRHLTKDRDDEEWVLLGFTEETATLTVDVGIDGYSGGDGFRFVIAVDGPHYNDGKTGMPVGSPSSCTPALTSTFTTRKRPW